MCGMSCQDAAIRKFEQALEVFEKSDDRRGEANALTHFGLAKFSGVRDREGMAEDELRGAFHQALDYFDRAKDIYDQDIGVDTADMINLLEVSLLLSAVVPTWPPSSPSLHTPKSIKV